MSLHSVFRLPRLPASPLVFHHRSRACLPPYFPSMCSPSSSPAPLASLSSSSISAAVDAAVEADSAINSASGSGNEDPKKPSRWLVVGLGNPGSKFQGTRHNVGFDMIDTISKAEGIKVDKIQYKALVGKGTIGGKVVLLAKPQTYMNLSGEAVRPLSAYYKIPSENILVIYDDLDLEVAAVKLLPKGGHGGHNGMKSIIESLKSRDFPRLRIGIGRPPGTMSTAAYVLQRFASNEQQEVDLLMEDAVNAIQLIITEGIDKAVSTWNKPRKSRDPTFTPNKIRKL